MRTITLIAHDTGEFDIHEGEDVVGRLTWDEMLGTVAVITHPQLGRANHNVPPYRMRHIDQILDDRADYVARLRARDSSNQGE